MYKYRYYINLAFSTCCVISMAYLFSAESWWTVDLLLWLPWRLILMYWPLAIPVAGIWWALLIRALIYRACGQPKPWRERLLVGPIVIVVVILLFHLLMTLASILLFMFSLVDSRDYSAATSQDPEELQHGT